MKKDEKPTKKGAKININTKTMGVNIDKNEYREIVTSNTNFPEKSFFKRDY